MTTAVIGATGRGRSQFVRGVLARGDAVAALVRDPGKARRAFGEPGGLHIRATRLDDPRDLTEALDGIRTVFIAMGSVGIEGVLQRIAINAAAAIGSVEQVTRLSVLNASADSLGINQRAHHSIAIGSGKALTHRSAAGDRENARQGSAGRGGAGRAAEAMCTCSVSPQGEGFTLEWRRVDHCGVMVCHKGAAISGHPWGVPAGRHKLRARAGLLRPPWCRRLAARVTQPALTLVKEAPG